MDLSIITPHHPISIGKMAEEDFDLDIYGDAEGGQEQHDDANGQETQTYDYDEEQHDEQHEEQHDKQHDEQHDEQRAEQQAEQQAKDEETKEEVPGGQNVDDMDRQEDGGPAPASSAPQQGTKRKQEEDLAADKNATNAILISDMQWWHDEEQIRDLANDAGCEDELKEVSFSEHKVNGKSKG